MRKNIQERDKPFILALISVGIFMLGVILCIIYNKWEYIKEWTAISSPYMSMSWAWYFSREKKTRS